MPALPVVPNVLKVSFTWTNGDDTTIGSSLHFAYSGSAPSNADCLAFATSIATIADADFTGIQATDVTLTGVKVQDLSSGSGGVGEVSVSYAGTISGNQPAGSVCLLANYEIARRYRGGKPRSYFPFGAASDLTLPSRWSTTFTAAVHTNLVTAITAISALTHGSTDLGAQVSVSYYDGFTNVAYGSPTKYRRVPTLRTDPVVDNISGISIRTIIGSQRRRNV